nr:probable gamma-glutamyl hydrolase 3 isoform X3 [Nicotiana tomentosiformis]
MAGARVIPLTYTEPPEILNQKLNLIIFKALSSLEGMSIRVSTLKLLNIYSSESGVYVTMENIKLEGTVFGRFPLVLLKKMSIHCLVMQNHHELL